jgi:hypothetical protein
MGADWKGRGATGAGGRRRVARPGAEHRFKNCAGVGMIDFRITGNEEKKLLKWQKRQEKKSGPTGYSYVFTTTGIGTKIEVVCHKTGQSIDLTDYERW